MNLLCSTLICCTLIVCTAMMGVYLSQIQIVVSDKPLIQQEKYNAQTWRV